MTWSAQGFMFESEGSLPAPALGARCMSPQGMPLVRAAGGRPLPLYHIRWPRLPPVSVVVLPRHALCPGVPDAP